MIVIGGGNSAGQAAVFLAQMTKRVHVLVRSSSLAESMSRYLVRRIEGSHNITLRTVTEIVALEGDDHLESVRWRNSKTGQTEQHKIRHVFIITGPIQIPVGLRAASHSTLEASLKQVLIWHQKA